MLVTSAGMVNTLQEILTMHTLYEVRTKSKSTHDAEALLRGTRHRPNGNDTPVILAFMDRGLAESDVITFGDGQNVRTFPAWRALGRHVRKGERSVRCTVWLHVDGKEKLDGKKEPGRSFRKTACVFHVSQTDTIGGGA